MPDIVFELSTNALTAMVHNSVNDFLQCRAQAAGFFVTDLDVLSVQPVRGDFQWGPPNDPGAADPQQSVLGIQGFVTRRQTPRVNLSSGSAATVATAATLLLVDLSLRLVQLDSSGQLARMPQPVTHHWVPPQTDSFPVVTMARDSLSPTIRSLVFLVSASANAVGGVDLQLVYLGALGNGKSTDQLVLTDALDVALKSHPPTGGAVPNPRVLSLPAPPGAQVVNAGFAVPPWDTYSDPPPGIRLAVDLLAPDTAEEWEAFYSGQGWSLPVGRLWSIAVSDGWIAATLKSQVQMRLNAQGQPQWIAGSAVSDTGSGTWRAALEVHDPVLGYLGNLNIDISPAVTPSNPPVQLDHGLSATLCASVAESFGAEIKAIVLGIALGGWVGGGAGAILGGVIVGIVAAAVAGQMGSDAMHSVMTQVAAKLHCTNPDSHNCVTCSFDPETVLPIIPGVGRLDAESFYAPSGYLALYGGTTGWLRSLDPPRLQAAVGDWGTPFVPCQGLGATELPIAIENLGQLGAWVCSITQRIRPGDPPPVIPPTLKAPAVAGGWLWVTGPSGYSRPLTVTIVTTAGCFELDLPTPIPKVSLAEVEYAIMVAHAMCTFVVSPIPIIPSITYTDPVPDVMGSIIRERVWASAVDMAQGAHLVVTTRDGTILATAPTVNGEAAVTAAMPIAGEFDQSHLFVRLESPGKSVSSRSFGRSLYRLRSVIELHQPIRAVTRIDQSRFRLTLAGGVIGARVDGRAIEWSGHRADTEPEVTADHRWQVRLTARGPQTAVEVVPVGETATSQVRGSGREPALTVFDGGWLASLAHDGEIAVEVQRHEGRILIWDEYPTSVDLQAGFCVRSLTPLSPHAPSWRQPSTGGE